MKKTGIKRIILAVGVLCLLLVVGYFIRQNSHVRFKDENMGIVICNTIGHGITPENVRYKDLKKVDYLSIGCVGWYTTLADIKKCTNIKDLTVNGYVHEFQPAYEVTQNEYGRELTEEDSVWIEEELKVVVPKLRKLREFSYSIYSENSDIKSWDFLELCPSLVAVYIWNSDVTDYSFLNAFKGMKFISLWGCKVESADALINLQAPERLCVYDTPLVEKEEEIQKLCEALPNTEILISGDRIENDRDWDWSWSYE